MGSSRNVDDYITNVILIGDEGSRLLAEKCRPTLKNCEYVDVITEGMNGLAILKNLKDYFLVVHSAGGDPKKKDLGRYSASMVDKLYEQARLIGATPLAFADVIDSNTGSLKTLEIIADSMVDKANEYGLAIINGENAVLGSRINRDACEANVSGTMISITDNVKEIPFDWSRIQANSFTIPGGFTVEGERYALLNPALKMVTINSDGVGTKTELYERAKKYRLAPWDSAAMKCDDTGKFGGEVVAISDIVETKGDIPFDEIEEEASAIGNKLGAVYIVQEEKVGERLMGYNKEAPSFNVSGSVVSVIDEEKLRHPLAPKAGDYILSIRGKPTPRSNAISKKRKIMKEVIGKQLCEEYGANEWHETPIGQWFLEYLAQPSTVFYPVFNKLTSTGLANSVTHMSGGAYNGKFARMLAKHGLYGSIGDLFEPDARELAILGASGMSIKDAYGQSPMGNEAFVTSNHYTAAITLINQSGLEAKVVGRVKKAKRRGLGISTFNGKKIYFNGN